MLHYVGSVHARSLTRTYMYMYMAAGRFLHSPGHDCINSVRSGQHSMADTIASDTGTFEWFYIRLKYDAFTNYAQCVFKLHLCIVSLLQQ